MIHLNFVYRVKEPSMKKNSTALIILLRGELAAVTRFTCATAHDRGTLLGFVNGARGAR